MGIIISNMGILSWIIFGALAGWVASLVMSRPQGCFMNAIVGVVGAFIGGLVINLLTGNRVIFGWSWGSFGIAVLGAVILLAIVSNSRRGKR